ADLEGHLKECADCREELETLKRASAGFKSKGARRAPQGLDEAVLERAGRKEPPRPQSVLRFALTVGAVLLLLVCFGRMFKPQISQMFNQIMAMVSGAASSVSSGN
ncbi:hypothetical protein ACFL2T_08115, partial [Elusimicrobiota bacterium]